MDADEGMSAVEWLWAKNGLSPASYGMLQPLGRGELIHEGVFDLAAKGPFA